jgi:DNA repair ATPase RecN
MPSDSKVYDYKQFPADPKPKRYKLYKEEQLNEISYRRFNESVNKVSPERKITRALSEVNKRVKEIEQVIEYSNRLKTENVIKRSNFWDSKLEQLNELSRRLNQLSKNIKKLSNG